MKEFNLEETKQNSLYDTINLRIEADYEIEVADDVYWVPVNQLGGSRLTNYDISKLITLTPGQKQSKINTLYEAIQLYQASNFRGVFDNYMTEIWNFHKPGHHAVRTNEGCCASNSNWLSYFLYTKYEQMGFIHYSQSNGSGHIMNYIFHNGWYYFIDMMMYRTDSLPFAGKETGTINGYKDKELISGNLHKSKMPISYVNYCLANHKDAPIFFTMMLEKEVVALGADPRDLVVDSCSETMQQKIREHGFDILHPPSTKTIVLYKEKNFKLDLKFKEPEICDYKWESIPTDIFENDISV
jgi:hypothetical protein